MCAPGMTVSFFVYTLAHDSGFAPNPFHGYCTLACCKPKIRARANVGDWVLGITPKHLGHRLAYAMRVSASLSFEQYFSDRRFAPKKPRWKGGVPLVEWCGDNCYKPMSGGRFRQLPSDHYDHERGCEDLQAKASDLGGKYVLVSDHFAYFGSKAIPVPGHLRFMMPARYHRVNFSSPQERSIQMFVDALPLGVHGHPRKWKSGDATWRTPGRCA